MTRIERQIEEFRKGDACIQLLGPEGNCLAGIPVSVEQESHAFVFGCVVPDLITLSPSDRERYQARLNEVFNCLVPAGLPAVVEPGVLRVDVAERVHLGRLRLRLDQLASPGLPLQVHVWGETAGLSASAESGSLDERGAGKRVAELVTLCFGHPSVSGVFWNGFADGEPGIRGGGLLRRDLAPKYACKVLQKLIGLVWHTRAAGVADAEGMFRFRGFFGSYRVVARIGEAMPLVETISLRPERLTHILTRPELNVTGM